MICRLSDPVPTIGPEVPHDGAELLARGAQALTERELLVLVLRNGTRGLSALDLAAELLAEYGSLARLAATPHSRGVRGFDRPFAGSGARDPQRPPPPRRSCFCIGAHNHPSGDPEPEVDILRQPCLISQPNLECHAPFSTQDPGSAA